MASIAVFLICGLSHTAYAQTKSGEANSGEYLPPEGGLQISPIKFVWTLNSGEERTSKIVVKNYSDKDLFVHMGVEDFFVGDDGTEPQFFIPDTEHPLKAHDIIDWFDLPEDFNLGPDEAKVVDFTVRVPADSPTSGYYGSVFFTTGGDLSGDGSRIGLSYRIGSLVIIAVQGDEPMRIGADLSSFTVEKKWNFEKPIIMNAMVQSTGNVHYPMFGTIEITRFGKKFHTVEMKSRILYPEINNKYREVLEYGMWDFGKYTAKLAMHSENDAIKLDGETTFYIIPWKGLAIIGSGLLGIIIVKLIFSSLFKVERKKKRR